MPPKRKGTLSKDTIIRLLDEYEELFASLAGDFYPQVDGEGGGVPAVPLEWMRWLVHHAGFTNQKLWADGVALAIVDVFILRIGGEAKLPRWDSTGAGQAEGQFRVYLLQRWRANGYIGPFSPFTTPQEIDAAQILHNRITAHRNQLNLTSKDLEFLTYGMNTLEKLTGLETDDIIGDAESAFLRDNARTRSGLAMLGLAIADHYGVRNSLKRALLPTLVTHFRLLDGSVRPTYYPVDTKGKDWFQGVLLAAQKMDISDEDASALIANFDKSLHFGRVVWHEMVMLNTYPLSMTAFETSLQAHFKLTRQRNIDKTGSFSWTQDDDEWLFSRVPSSSLIMKQYFTANRSERVSSVVLCLSMHFTAPVNTKSGVIANDLPTRTSAAIHIHVNVSSVVLYALRALQKGIPLSFVFTAVRLERLTACGVTDDTPLAEALDKLAPEADEAQKARLMDIVNAVGYEGDDTSSDVTSSSSAPSSPRSVEPVASSWSSNLQPVKAIKPVASASSSNLQPVASTSSSSRKPVASSSSSNRKPVAPHKPVASKKRAAPVSDVDEFRIGVDSYKRAYPRGETYGYEDVDEDIEFMSDFEDELEVLERELAEQKKARKVASLNAKRSPPPYYKKRVIPPSSDDEE
ncbi:hypothetical protein JCM10449v2_001547 [Rhodotorula kratochvilovae]